MGEGACTRIGNNTRERPEQTLTYEQMSIRQHFTSQRNTMPITKKKSQNTSTDTSQRKKKGREQLTQTSMWEHI
eukprot:9529362-Ditylum_brightwellii.AAC.2